MGQTNTSTIIRQEALNLAQKNSKWRVINDAYEINQCLLMSSVIDQISYDLSSVSYKVSSMTVNPLTYDSVSFELLMKEDRMQMQSKIMYKYEVLRPQQKQRKYKTVTTQTELTSNDEIFQYSTDRKQQRNNHSFGSEIIQKYQVEERNKSQTDEKPNKKDQRLRGDKIFQEVKEPKTINNKGYNTAEKTNIFKLDYEQTENFSNDLVDNASIILQTQKIILLTMKKDHISKMKDIGLQVTHQLLQIFL
ncbi:unnamed protein product (macronuclear) [Paramecium tetraurelia]|uniref:Uncharacterized protein n=1 Tax=Paramecium tetraurelia TaxID=5888 RepID=A0DGU7_PARTE|nr:uncharacterized protein GSPATT00002393001 [Paramecium tetraurelia]CAK82264.1 unnamed protein product [Paramecium tetraurelia]|eukprot:XP_001449661.1 hypothetical protein (macronuclear) [Paramecium tetraurelia strain d4-2]